MSSTFYLNVRYIMTLEKHPNMIKFIDLLRSENENTWRKLATYIHKGFELRTRIYYLN